MVANEYKEMTVDQLAAVVRMDWVKVNYAAKPYLEAMFSLQTAQDNYGHDSGESILLYFLGNAKTWRGETARAVKAELKRRIGQ